MTNWPGLHNQILIACEKRNPCAAPSRPTQVQQRRCGRIAWSRVAEFLARGLRWTPGLLRCEGPPSALQGLRSAIPAQHRPEPALAAVDKALLADPRSLSRCVPARFFDLPSQFYGSSRIPEFSGFVPASRQDPRTVGTKRRMNHLWQKSGAPVQAWRAWLDLDGQRRRAACLRPHPRA